MANLENAEKYKGKLITYSLHSKSQVITFWYISFKFFFFSLLFIQIYTHMYIL